MTTNNISDTPSYLIHAELVLIAVELEDGVFTREPGHLLMDLASTIGVSYQRASLVVLQMEADGFIAVERLMHDEPKQSNRLVSIRIV